MTTQQLQHRLNEAIAHHNAGRFDRAEAIYRQLAQAAPRVAVVFDLWGRLAEQQGRSEDAIRYYTQACRLDERLVTTAIQIASIYIAIGRAADAEKTLRWSVQKNPRSAAAYNALGFALKVQGRIPDAIACHQRAVTIDPKFVDGWLHYGLTLGLIGRNFQALPHYERALALDPSCAAARFGRAQSLDKVYRMEEAIAEYEAFLRMQPQHLEAMSNRLFVLQNSDALSREQRFADHRAYGKAVGEGPAVPPDYDLSPDRRLKVAILSADLRTHSCAYFIEPLIRHLDPAQFELYLYHDHFVEDTMSARLRGYAKVWRNFVGQAHGTVERAIREDKPDIAIDLGGHVGIMVRLPVFAKRIAPVQITYLGYPDTTGVPAMDFRFTDPIADPPGEADRFATEKLVRFAPVAWAYQPPLDAPEIAPSPCATGAPVTFGCFNSPTKFTNALFKAWALLMAEVPDSRLVLKGRDFEEAPVREQMLARMAAQGIPVDRLELLPRTVMTVDHLSQYSRIDVALDTFPYTGTTTTCEALWMGRPVVTLCGDRHAARVGASLLTAAGHPEWIAQSPEEYVRIAVGLARTRSAITAHAVALRTELAKSALLDHPAQSARFAQALRECWRAKVTPHA